MNNYNQVYQVKMDENVQQLFASLQGRGLVNAQHADPSTLVAVGPDQNISNNPLVAASAAGERTYMSTNPLVAAAAAGERTYMSNNPLVSATAAGERT